MVIDLKAFRVELEQAEPGKSVDNADLSQYLMDNLLVPYLMGADIRLDSLDYDAFDLEELERLNDFIGDVQSASGKVGYIRENLKKSVAAARKAKAFC